MKKANQHKKEIDLMKKITAVILCLAVIAGFTVLPANAKITIFDYHIPFDVWQGEGDVSVFVKYADESQYFESHIDKINNALAFDSFEKLTYHDTEISSEFYTVENKDGFALITLREEYIKNLEDGKYYFDAEFKNIDMPLLLCVITEKAVVDDVVFDIGNHSGVQFISFTLTGVEHPIGSELIEYISHNGERIPDNCWISSFMGNDGIIQFSEEFTEALPEGQHEFHVEFISVSGIKLRVNIVYKSWAKNVEDITQNRLQALGDHRTGDIDGDGRITASDARKVLRYSAQLEELEIGQIGAADANGKNGVTSADARKILRIAAGLDKPEQRVLNTYTRWGLVFGELKTAGSGRYFWHCEVDKDGLEVSEKRFESNDGKDGAPAEQYFIFSAEKDDTYTVTFTLSDADKTEIIDTFTTTIVVD